MLEIFTFLKETLFGFYNLSPWFFKIFLALNILPILLKRYLRVDTSSNLTDEQKKKNRVIIVGGGFSGIGMGCILKMAGMDFLILEKGSQVGGTWNYNKFPGAATDAKCAGYSFTFYDFKDWKRVYPYRDEILSYIYSAVDHFDIGTHFKFNSGMKSATWDETTSSWNVETESGVVYNGKFLINCMGFLYKPNFPKLKGMDSFKGRLFHSARWEDDFDYTGKKVAVIGSGCTAVQVVPEVAKVAESVTMFSRGMMTPVLEKPSDTTYGPIWRFMWRLFPGSYVIEQMFYRLLNELFYYAFDDNPLGRAVTKQCIKVWETELKDYPELKEQFKFETPVTLCKRLPIYNNFYSKFAKLGCKMEQAGIEELIPKGIRTKDGRELEFDLIVFCTGFDMFHYRDTPIVGRDGFNIATEWDTNVPYARTGCQIKGCPNYFMILGPQSGQIHGTGSVTYGENQAELAWRTIRYTLENGFENFEVKAEKFEEWKNEYDTYQKEKKAWLTQCSSWYHKNGKPWQPWLFHSSTMMQMCKWSDIRSQYNFK